jgi:dolichol kinase
MRCECFAEAQALRAHWGLCDWRKFADNVLRKEQFAGHFLCVLMFALSWLNFVLFLFVFARIEVLSFSINCGGQTKKKTKKTATIRNDKKSFHGPYPTIFVVVVFVCWITTHTHTRTTAAHTRPCLTEQAKKVAQSKRSSFKNRSCTHAHQSRTV